MAFLSHHPMAAALAVVLVVYLVSCIVSFVQHRRRMSKLPGPPHHPIFGHLISIGKVVTKLPKRIHPHSYPAFLRKAYNLPPVFYMDSYPFRKTPILIILDPETAQHASAEIGLNKAQSLRDTIEPLAGRENLVNSDGALWKKWRNVFNPGFSLSQLMDQVPVIVDFGLIFVDILDKHAAKNEIFRLEEDATKMTIDVIGKVICDHDFNALSSENEFVGLMRKTIAWMPDTQSLDPFHQYHPFRHLYWNNYKKRMDNYIGKVLDERFASRDAHQPRKVKKKTGIDLALLEYFKESGEEVDSQTATMNADFRRHAINNLEVLLFAGHDTTASTICYCYYLLHKNPASLHMIRDELDRVFGASKAAAPQLQTNPHLINQCEYTLAVVKEVLRLYAPASTIRDGRKDLFIRDPTTGEMLPTEGSMVWVVAMSIHRDPQYWGEDVHEFKPERFLPENADKLVPNAWRPFEKGPRNCIGQELAMLELKIMLVMTIREFDIKSAYGELDTLNTDGSLWAAEKSFRGGVQECWGDPAYQVLLAAAKPREGMPARVSRRMTMK